MKQSGNLPKSITITAMDCMENCIGDSSLTDDIMLSLSLLIQELAGLHKQGPRGDRRVLKLKVLSIDLFIKKNPSLEDLIKRLREIVTRHNLSMIHKFRIKSLLWKKITRYNTWTVEDKVHGDYDRCQCPEKKKWRQISESAWDRDEDGVKYYYEEQIHRCPERYDLDELVIYIGFHPRFKKNKTKVWDTVVVEL